MKNLMDVVDKCLTMVLMINGQLKLLFWLTVPIYGLWYRCNFAHRISKMPKRKKSEDAKNFRPAQLRANPAFYNGK